VSLQQAQAVVRYDPSQVTIEAMIELLHDTGYRASAP
jgi:copper chaperone CopZ